MGISSSTSSTSSSELSPFEQKRSEISQKYGLNFREVDKVMYLDEDETVTFPNGTTAYAAKTYNRVPADDEYYVDIYVNNNHENSRYVYLG